MVENELPAQSIAVIPRSARSGATLAPSLSKSENGARKHNPRFLTPSGVAETGQRDGRKAQEALARLHSGGSLNRSHACTAGGRGSFAAPTGQALSKDFLSEGGVKVGDWNEVDERWEGCEATEDVVLRFLGPLWMNQAIWSLELVTVGPNNPLPKVT